MAEPRRSMPQIAWGTPRIAGCPVLTDVVFHQSVLVPWAVFRSGTRTKGNFCRVGCYQIIASHLDSRRPHLLITVPPLSADPGFRRYRPAVIWLRTLYYAVVAIQASRWAGRHVPSEVCGPKPGSVSDMTVTGTWSQGSPTPDYCSLAAVAQGLWSLESGRSTQDDG